MRASASCISDAVAKRRSRSFAIALRMTIARASGTSALSVRGLGGSSSKCFATSAHVVSASKGRRPVKHSNSTTPAEYRSLRSEEHTSELQSRLHLVCRLLLEKKKKKASRTRREAQKHKRMTH